ncbi:hypothetical protein C2845_PM15G06740 [Panicum miliaceum]|uniref:Pollen-specific protein C13-like n=1 Tax=Panicum miliaceum TaxID=4540 RepID=A0A3L6QDL3_PANMI|nr:hypothetical protein C2845_PM15G06740 [Panicum miliaceum]
MASLRILPAADAAILLIRRGRRRRRQRSRLRAKVRLECKHFGTGNVERAIDGVTDETGTYKIELKDGHEEDICEVVLVQSPRKDCDEVRELRDRASVLLTRNVGICDSVRLANPLGYFKDVPLPVCSELLKKLDLDDQTE